MNTVTSRTGERDSQNSRSYAYRTDEHRRRYLYPFAHLDTHLDTTASSVVLKNT